MKKPDFQSMINGGGSVDLGRHKYEEEALWRRTLCWFKQVDVGMSIGL